MPGGSKQRTDEAVAAFRAACAHAGGSGCLKALVDAVLLAGDGLISRSTCASMRESLFRTARDLHTHGLDPRLPSGLDHDAVSVFLAMAVMPQRIWEKCPPSSSSGDVLRENRNFLTAANGCTLLSSAVMEGILQRSKPMFVDDPVFGGACEVVGVSFCRGHYQTRAPIFFPIMRTIPGGAAFSVLAPPDFQLSTPAAGPAAEDIQLTFKHNWLLLQLKPPGPGAATFNALLDLSIAQFRPDALPRYLLGLGSDAATHKCMSIEQPTARALRATIRRQIAQVVCGMQEEEEANAAFAN